MHQLNYRLFVGIDLGQWLHHGMRHRCQRESSSEKEALLIVPRDCRKPSIGS